MPGVHYPLVVVPSRSTVEYRASSRVWAAPGLPGEEARGAEWAYRFNDIFGQNTVCEKGPFACDVEHTLAKMEAK